MYFRFDALLRQHGYQEVPLNIKGLHFHMFREACVSYSVITIDETSGLQLSPEQFRHISEQLRSYLIQQNCTDNHFLYVLITANPSSGRRLFFDYDCYWLIDTTERKLIVFEDKEPVFEALRKPLEQLLDASEIPQTGNASASSFSFSRIPATITLVLLNVLIFLATDFFASPESYLLIDRGALSWDKVFNDGQYYRILTSMFLHSGIDHIFNNMLVLLVIGNYLERKAGSLRFLGIYFSSGILAGCTSMVYNMLQNDYTPSIGASGAIFGMMGAMLCIVLLKRGRQEYSPRQILFMVFLSLYGGFTSQGVDNAAHVGGFISGFLMTLLLCQKERQE